MKQFCTHKKSVILHSHWGMCVLYTEFSLHLPAQYTRTSYHRRLKVDAFLQTGCYSRWAVSHHTHLWLEKHFIFITSSPYCVPLSPPLYLSPLVLLLFFLPCCHLCSLIPCNASDSSLSLIFLSHPFPLIPLPLSIFTTPLLLSLCGSISIHSLPSLPNLSSIPLLSRSLLALRSI